MCNHMYYVGIYSTILEGLMFILIMLNGLFSLFS